MRSGLSTFNQVRQIKGAHLEDHVPAGMRTKVDVINEMLDKVIFNGYSAYGFVLSNGALIPGPIIAFPKVILQWKVKIIGLINLRFSNFFLIFKVMQASDLTPESLSIFRVISPKPGTVLHVVK